MNTQGNNLVGDIYEVTYRHFRLWGCAGSREMVNKWLERREIEAGDCSIKHGQYAASMTCRQCNTLLVQQKFETIGPIFFVCDRCVWVYRSEDLYWIGDFEAQTSGLFPFIDKSGSDHRWTRVPGYLKSACPLCHKSNHQKIARRFSPIDCRKCGVSYYAKIADFRKFDFMASLSESAVLFEEANARKEARRKKTLEIEKIRALQEIERRREEQENQRREQDRQAAKARQEAEEWRAQQDRAAAEAQRAIVEKRYAFYRTLGIGLEANETELRSTFACLPPVCGHAAILTAEALLTDRLKHNYEVESFEPFIRDALVIEKLRVSGEDLPNEEIERYLAVVVPRFGLQIAAAAVSLAIWEKAKHRADLDAARNKQAVKGALKAALVGGLAAVGISALGA